MSATASSSSTKSTLTSSSTAPSGAVPRPSSKSLMNYIPPLLFPFPTANVDNTTYMFRLLQMLGDVPPSEGGSRRLTRSKERGRKASPVLRRPCTPSAASPSVRARSRIANTLPHVLGGSLHLGHLATESLVEVSGRAPSGWRVF